MAKMLLKRLWGSFLGDCSIVDEWLSDKPVFHPFWFICHYLNIFLRSVSQTCFVNNPISGGLTLAATFVTGWKIGIGTLLGGSVATISEMILGLHDWTMMRNGVAPFNGALYSTVTTSLFTVYFRDETTSILWAFVAGGAFISIFVCSALGNVLGKFGVPYLTFPFNILAITSFLTLQTIYPKEPAPTAVTTLTGGCQEEMSSIASPPLGIALINASTNAANINQTFTIGTLCAAGSKEIVWSSVGMGIVLSMGQVWALKDVTASLMINVAVFLHSPLLFVMTAIGSVITTLLGAAFLPHEDLWEVYDGIWGFNGVLAMGGVSCVFYAFGPMSFLLGIVDCVAVAIAHFALRANMALQNHIPVFTAPFAITTLMFLATTDTKGNLFRVQNFSYPEKQSADWRRQKKNYKGGK